MIHSRHCRVDSRLGCFHADYSQRTHQRSPTRSSCPGRSGTRPGASSPCSRPTPSCSPTRRRDPSRCWRRGTDGRPAGVSGTSGPPWPENWRSDTARHGESVSRDVNPGNSRRGFLALAELQGRGYSEVTAHTVFLEMRRLTLILRERRDKDYSCFPVLLLKM